MSGTELGIVDTRNIIRLVNELYQYDFSDFALTSFKRRLERMMELHNIKYADQFLLKFREDPSFLETFLNDIVVEPTEMFRDPSLWRLLRDEYLPGLMQQATTIRVWFPQLSSAEELISFLILVKESGFEDKVSITATSLSNYSLEEMKKGKVRLNKMEVSEDNYIRYHGKARLAEYYRVSEGYAWFDPELLGKVSFMRQNLSFESVTRSNDMIFFRNKLLYFNQTLQDKVLKSLYESLAFSGYLVLGIRERANWNDPTRILRAVNEEESIYVRK